MTNVNEYILSLAGRIGLAPEAAEYALPVACQLEQSGHLAELWPLVLEDPRAAVKWFEAHAAEYGCEPYRLSLAASLLLTRSTKALYAEKGYDEQIFWDSMRDIAIWAKCCKDQTGRWGMKQFHWLSKTLRAELWRLGRMQFEWTRVEGFRYEKNGVSLKEGDPVINTHIPEGEPLTPEKRTDAFDRAVRFFGSSVFLCESWMLWPAHYQMLKPESNIISFMNDFDIFESFEQPGVADLWRFFGYLPDYRPDRLPAVSSLQRAYAEKLRQNGGLTGGGWGVHVHSPRQ